MARWIVCGIARGPHDRETLTTAARVAERVGARLAIVTVVPAPGDGSHMREAVAEGRRAVADAARRCAVVDDAVHAVEVGDPVDGLARVGAELDADLIVIGRTRRSALTSLARAGVAPRLSRRLGRPVAVVPARVGSDAIAVLAAAADGRAAERSGWRPGARRRLSARVSSRLRRPLVIASR